MDECALLLLASERAKGSLASLSHSPVLPCTFCTTHLSLVRCPLGRTIRDHFSTASTLAVILTTAVTTPLPTKYDDRCATERRVLPSCESVTQIAAAHTFDTSAIAGCTVPRNWSHNAYARGRESYKPAGTSLVYPTRISTNEVVRTPRHVPVTSTDTPRPSPRCTAKIVFTRRRLLADAVLHLWEWRALLETLHQPRLLGCTRWHTHRRYSLSEIVPFGTTTVATLGQEGPLFRAQRWTYGRQTAGNRTYECPVACLMSKTPDDRSPCPW